MPVLVDIHLYEVEKTQSYTVLVVEISLRKYPSFFILTQIHSNLSERTRFGSHRIPVDCIL